MKRIKVLKSQAKQIHGNFENAKFSGSRLKLNFVDFGFLNEYQSVFDIIRGTIIHNEFIT